MFRAVGVPRARGRRVLAAAAVGLCVAGAAGAGINRWTSGGPWSGNVTAIAADPSNPQTVYAAAQYAGIFRSRDGGASWQAINRGLLDSWITGLAIDPAAPTTLYASSYGFFVYKSTDAGDHWVSQYVNDPASSYGLAYAVAVDPWSPSNVYAATLAGVWKTSDGGCSWSPSNQGLPTTQIGAISILVDPADDSVVLLSTFQNGLYRSGDAGATWTSVQTFFTGQHANQFAADSSNGAIFYAATSYFIEPTAEEGGAIYKSGDGGLTWGPLGSLPNVPFSGVASDPYSPAVYATSYAGGVFRSLDGGASWTDVTNGLPAPARLVPGPESGLFWASAGAGVFETTDSGGHWSDVSTGISGVLYGHVVVDATNDSTLWCSNSWSGGKGVFRSTDGGASWTNASSGLGTGGVGPLVAMPGPPLTLFAAENSHAIYRSTDMGDTWVAAGSLGDTATPGVTALMVPPTNPGRLYAVAGPLFYSNDQGVTWAAASPDPHFLDFVAADVEVDGSLIGTVDGIVQRSTDSGATWTPSDVGLETAAVNSITQDPAIPDHMLAAVQGDAVAMTVPVYQSNDRGATWTPSSGGLPQKINAAWIVFDPLAASTVYATAYAFNSPGEDVARPIYRSLDGGATWAPYDRGLPSRKPDSGQITAAASGSIYYEGLGGVFEIRSSSTPPPSVSGIEPHSGTPSGDTLVLLGGSGLGSTTSVKFGPTDASFLVVDDSHVAAIAPPGTSGAVAVTVATDEPQDDTLARAYVYDFADLPPGSLFHESVVALTLRAVTGGCGAGNFCPNAPLNRGQAAVQIEKAVRGADYPFDPVYGGNTLSMADVDRCSGFGPYIQQFLFDGITAGCGYPNYCPLSPVTRAQMMVFLLRAEHGPSYVPPPATGTVFNDVPADSFAADYIEAAAQEGITGGCGGGNFCPGSPVTRGQAAALIFKTFPSAP